jgi:hypothetical protein
MEYGHKLLADDAPFFNQPEIGEINPVEAPIKIENQGGKGESC